MSRKKLGSAPLEIVYRKVGDLQSDPLNSRQHPPEQIGQLRASIRHYGFTKPVLLKDDGKTIGAGNGAWAAAVEEGLKQIPTITITGLTDQQWRAYAIADNRIPLNAGWNEDVLRAELTALHILGFDLNEMGFGDLELGTLGVDGFALEERIERAEETPEPPKKPVTKVGELWILGPHRLLIGDSSNAENVSRLLAGVKPNLMVTDPPYGVNYDANWRNTAMRKTGKAIGGRAIGKVSNDHEADWTPAWKLFPGDVAYVWHGALHAATVQRSLENAGLLMRTQIIWNKTRFVISRGDYHYRHEPCWYAVRKGKPGSWSGDRKQTTVWDVDHRKSETGHSTQKPIECMRRPILNNSKMGDSIYEPFAGSGTTLIAAHMETRHCFAMELDPAYGQVIIERWEKFADAIATREDGKTLAQLKKGKA